MKNLLSRLSKDPLLAAARILLALIYGLLIFAMVMVSIGAIAVVTLQHAKIAADIAAVGLPPATIWGISAGLLAVVGILFLALRFVTELGRIVTTVDQGDPFIPENAVRLSRMGWLVVAIHAIGIPLAVCAGWLSRYSEGNHKLEGDFSSSGLVLILTLFILARVFQRGTAMREELEGTV